jgi:hypothetical protein
MIFRNRGGYGQIDRMSVKRVPLDAVRQIAVPQFSDQRGELYALERLRPLPFTPVRTFVITDVPPGKHRAEHLVSCDQFLWMLMGACQAAVRPEAGSEDQRCFGLAARGPGLYLPEGIWLDLYQFLPGSVLMCLAAAGYDAQRRR